MTTWNTFTKWLKLREAAATSMATPDAAGELDKQVATAAADATKIITDKQPKGTNPADVIQNKQPDIVKQTTADLNKSGIKAPLDMVAKAVQPPKMSKKK